jgi:hypothetical protein
MFGWFKRTDATPTVTAAEPPATPTVSMLEVYKSPQALANWVGDFLVDKMPWRNDLSLLPEEDTLVDLDIGPVERERFAKERSVLRVAGVALLILQQYKPGEFQDFLDVVAKRLATGLDDSANVSLYQKALVDYAHACQNKDESASAALYLQRVHCDSRHYLRLKQAGVGFTAVHAIMNAYEVARDQYFKTLTGFNYDNYMEFTQAAAARSEATAPVNAKL